MNKRYAYSWLVVVLLILQISACSAGTGNGAKPFAVQGIMNLESWDFANDGSVDLNGDWAFYWHALLTPERFFSGSTAGMTGYFSVPGVWNGRGAGKVRQSGDGFATFRLKVKIRPDSPPLAVRILDQTSSYKLWVNGRLVAVNGTVGTSRGETVPQYLFRLAPVPGGSSELDFVMQIANFNHSKGGFWNPVTLGNEADLFRKQGLKWGLEIFLFGCLSLMGAYHICLFVLKRNDRSVLYFGLFSLVVAVRTALTENRFFTWLIPEFPWELVFKMELLTVHLAFLLLLLFIHSLYSDLCPRFPVRFLQGVCVLFGLITCVSPARISSLLVEPFHPFILLIQLFIFYLLVKAVVKGRDGAATLLGGLLIFFLAVINDILHNHGVIATSYLAPFGFLFLVGSQSLALAQRYSLAFFVSEQLSTELTRKNLALENELVEISRLEREIVNIGEEERRCISYELHDGICQMLTGARLQFSVLAQKLSGESMYRGDVEQISSLLEESVNHAYNLSRGLWPSEYDLNGLGPSLEDLVARLSDSSGISIELIQKERCGNCPNPVAIQLYRIAQEAISNAIRHSHCRNIYVTLSRDDQKAVVLTVQDNGLGRNNVKKTKGGLGMGIMSYRAGVIGGTLLVSDAEDGGTVVTCTVPYAAVDVERKL